MPERTAISGSYSLRRYYVDGFFTRHAESLPAGARVLDVGGHRVRKRGDFDIEAYALRVTCVNIVTDKRPHIQADAAALPLRAAAFDAALCGEVLEHVPDPRAVLAEIARVLRPGATLLATVPFLFPIHADPHDYGRYTDTFWRQTLTAAGFAQIEIERHGLYFSVMAEFWRQHLRQMDAPNLWRRVLRATGNRLLYRVAIPYALRHDARPQSPFHTSFTTGFGIKAVRA